MALGSCLRDMYLRLFVVLVFVGFLGSVAHGRKVELKESKGDDLACKECKLIVEFLDSHIASNATFNYTKKELDDICDTIPDTWKLKEKCLELVEEYGDFLIFMFEEEVTPDRVCALLGVCQVNDSLPHFVHLAFAGGNTGMSVTWLTYNPTKTSMVKYSESFIGPYKVMNGTAKSYLTTAGYHHTVVLTGLKPQTKYYYLCGDETAGYSKQANFITPPAEPQPFTIATYGDMGVHNSENTIPRITQLVEQQQIDWVYHVGDISYADDYLGNIYEYVWDEWFKSMETITSRVGYMVCPGNHEYSCEHPECLHYSKNFTAYNYRFRMPGPESNSNTNMFFSFDYSYVHFISISSETDYPRCPYAPKFGDQLTWLEKDLQLANQNRSPKRPWIIVVGHRPIYSSGSGYEDKGVPLGSAKNLQDSFESLFRKYKVDLYIAGHVHNYERMYPTANNTRTSVSYNNPTSPVYIVTGAGGCIEGLTPWSDGPIPNWSASRFNTDQGFGLLSVNASSLSWKFYSSSDGVLQDQFVLTKS